MCESGGQITSGAPTTGTSNLSQSIGQATGYVPTGLGNLQTVWSRANAAASQPYQAYGGQLVAPETANQYGAMYHLANAPGTAAPYFSAGAGMVGAAGSPIGETEINRYLSPYQKQVIDATMANINETNARQQQQIMGNPVSQHALGGDRSRVAQAILAHQQGLANNQTLANLNNQNWEQAVRTATGQQQAGLASGNALANLGIGFQNAYQNAAQAYWNAAGQERQIEQDRLTAAYQQFQQQQAFPYQQAQFLAGIGVPTSGAMGGTQATSGNIQQTTNTATTPPGMTWLQAVLGGGSLVGGLVSGLNAKDGGRINRRPYPTPNEFARGGSIDEDDKELIDAEKLKEDDDPWEVEPVNYIGTPRIAVTDSRPFAVPFPGITNVSLPQTGSSNNSNTNSSANSIGTLIGKGVGWLADLFFEEGGAVRRYADGGDTFDERWSGSEEYSPSSEEDEEALRTRFIPSPWNQTAARQSPQRTTVPLPFPRPKIQWDETPVDMPRGAVVERMHAGRQPTTPVNQYVAARNVARSTFPSRVDPASMSEADIMDQRNIQKTMIQRPRLGQMVRDPDFWTKMGINILAADPKHGPIGAAARGAAGTIQDVEAKFKEDMTAAQKAQVLAANLKEHADRYNKMTPYQRRSLDVGRWTVVGQDKEGTPIQQDGRTGEIRKAPLQFTPTTRGGGSLATALERNSKYLVSIGAAPSEAQAVMQLRSSVSDPNRRATLLRAWTDLIIKNDPSAIGNLELARKKAEQMLAGIGAGSATGGLGESSASAIDYVPGQTRRKNNLWYNVDGARRQWLGADE